MFSVASAFWLHPPLIYVIVPWTLAAVACSFWSWRAFGVFFGISAVVLFAAMFVINQLPDVGGEWPRDEGIFWWAMVIYAAPAFIICALLANIAERRRERPRVKEELK